MKLLSRVVCTAILTGAFLALTAPLFTAVAAAAEVEQWGVFELALAGPAGGNPFLDVSLAARFSLDDAVVEVTGFYDGNGTYRLRFMPDRPGRWRFVTKSNAPELNGRAGELAVKPPSGRNHGPVRVRNTFHFAYADGTPYRQIGTTCYSWVHRTDEQEEQTLRTLSASAFNKIRMCVFPQDQPETNQRFFPFQGRPPQKWDVARFNPQFFRHLEQRVGQLLDLGIEADLILFHPYGRKWGFSTMDPASDDRYVRYLVARLAAFRNVWWSLANEYDFIRDKNKKETDWDRLFQIVQQSDPYGHLRSVHNGTFIYNHTLPWVTHASIQNGAAVEDPERAMLYRDVYRKPVVFDEVKYEGDHLRRWGQLSAQEMVLRFWNGLVAGTYVGHSEIFQRTPDPWLAGGGVLVGQSPPRLAFLRQIMDTMPTEGIDPIDKWQNARTAGKLGDFYLLYFGREAPQAWPFVLFRDELQDGMAFRVDIIDTWNMTTTPVEGTFTVVKKDLYVFVDKDGRSVRLPGRPYMALRIQRVRE